MPNSVPNPPSDSLSTGRWTITIREIIFLAVILLSGAGGYAVRSATLEANDAAQQKAITDLQKDKVDKSQFEEAMKRLDDIRAEIAGLRQDLRDVRRGK